MTRQFFGDALGWGFGLWLFGYVLGFIFFGFVPQAEIGWYVTPFGIAAALWVLYKKVRSGPLGRYLGVALAWTAIAVVLDHVLIVQLLQPEDGYYKFDVYLYYALTFLLPLLVGWRRTRTERLDGRAR